MIYTMLCGWLPFKPSTLTTTILIAIIFGVLLIVLLIIAIYVIRKSAVYEKQIYRLKTTIVIM